MDDHGAKVDQYPAAVAIALGARDRKPMLFGGFGDGVGNRARLDFRAPTHDDEGISDDRAAVQIQDGDVFSFFIFGRGADDF